MQKSSKSADVPPSSETFSQQLSGWLTSKKPKTLASLIDQSAEKSFAVLFLLLMSVPALPLPTGGLTHIFELVVMLLSLELIVGIRKVWLPKRWQTLRLPKKFETIALSPLLKLIIKIEKYSKPRLQNVLGNRFALRLVGVVVLVFTVFAFLAPPFSGLDTLPALGVVFIALALILEDIIVGLVGLILGIVGAGLVLTLDSLVFKLL